MVLSCELKYTHFRPNKLEVSNISKKNIQAFSINLNIAFLLSILLTSASYIFKFIVLPVLKFYYSVIPLWRINLYIKIKI